MGIDSWKFPQIRLETILSAAVGVNLKSLVVEVVGYRDVSENTLLLKISGDASGLQSTLSKIGPQLGGAALLFGSDCKNCSFLPHHGQKLIWRES